MTLLSVEKIETYYGKIRAIDGVSLSVESGEIVCLIGANGAGKTTTLMKYDPGLSGGSWVVTAMVPFRVKGNELELSVPKRLLGLTGSSISFDFKWCDNPADLKDPISLCTNGDTAPNRRFNYRCIWKK